MLSHEDNETLVRVGPGTPMGEMFRRFWIPFYPADRLPPDEQPRRVRLLGEDLVAFRDTEGRPGLVANACPHRGAPLMFGRNEECGLRCVYHGWKFDVDGRLLDVPAVAQAKRLRERVRLTAYPCRERNGILWTHLGPEAARGDALPRMEWNLVPEDNVFVSFRVQECNWLQALEGEIDSAHAPILHARIDGQGAINDWVAKRDLSPSFECLEQPFGLSIASHRRLDEETSYWRVNQFVMPFWTLVPPQSKFPELSGHAWVPMDDERTLAIMFSYHPTETLYPRSRELFRDGHRGRETGHPSAHGYQERSPTTPYAEFWMRFNPENGYGFDYDLQKETWFSGMPGLWVQDAACQSGVSAIYDRTRENLCASDTGIVWTRRLLLKHLAALADGGTLPAPARDPEASMVRAVSLTLPDGETWQTAGRGHMRARLGADFGYTP